MFRCNECGKSYSTRGTLTRHSKNHGAIDGRDENAHVCTLCHVSFRRRDLLTRHTRTVHGDSTQSPSNGKVHRKFSTHATRRRRHTACDNCRASRSRCDGGQPCSLCTRLGDSGGDPTCRYRSSGSRTSKDASLEHLQTETTSHVMPVAPITGPSFTANLDSFTVPESSTPFMNPPELGSNGLDGSNIGTTGYWPFSTAWQWAHEGLYLHGNEDIFSDSAMETMLANEQTDASGGRQHRGSSSVPIQTAQPILLPESPQDVFQLRIGDREIQTVDAPSLKSVVRAMVEFAADCPVSSEQQNAIEQSWHKFSLQLSQFITPTSHANQRGGEYLLDDLTNQYFDNFHPLWPLVPRDASMQVSIHPLLYLTMTSIGALYSGKNAAASYGSEMHQRIRKVLTHRSTRRDTLETHALDVGRAMLLAQVTALYFEQNGAFSAAQRLGAALNAHAHRMRLFTARKLVHETALRNHDLLLVEGRSMLAYGMLRAETFMSVFFNRKPLLSSEEINIPLPFGRYMNEAQPGSSSSLYSTTTGVLLFADLVRLALEPEEALPSLRPVDCELLLFGLQHEVWRFSHDPDLFARLTGASAPDEEYSNGRPVSSSSNASNSQDLLDLTTRRRMKNLKRDYSRTVTALKKWREGLAKCQLDYPPDQNRSTFLSGLILYELSFLRLFAPLEAIQQTAYQMQNLPTSDGQVVAQIRLWSQCNAANRALQSARDIWRILYQETSRSASKRAKYNILALIALTQAAAVVWAIVGLEAFPHEHFTNEGEPGNIQLQRTSNRSLMMLFADLYPRITASWGIQSSFSRVVTNLADSAFPVTPR